MKNNHATHPIKQYLLMWSPAVWTFFFSFNYSSILSHVSLHLSSAILYSYYCINGWVWLTDVDASLSIHSYTLHYWCQILNFTACTFINHRHLATSYWFQSAGKYCVGRRFRFNRLWKEVTLNQKVREGRAVQKDSNLTCFSHFQSKKNEWKMEYRWSPSFIQMYLNTTHTSFSSSCYDAKKARGCCWVCLQKKANSLDFSLELKPLR